MKITMVTGYDCSRNNQSFEAKKFRIPVDVIAKPEGMPWCYKYSLPGKWVREYDNPEAEAIYKKAQKVKDIDEKIALYKQMGHYELKNISLKERLIGLYNRICLKFL